MFVDKTVPVFAVSGVRPLRFSVVLLSVGLVLGSVSGCAPSVDTEVVTQQSVSEVAIPKSKAGEVAGWVVGQINAADGVDVGALTERMDAVLLKGITAKDLAGVLNERQGQKTWVSTAVKETETDGDPMIFVRLQSESKSSVAILQVVVSAKSGKMTGIHFLAPGTIAFDK